jgi:exonuclease III
MTTKDIIKINGFKYINKSRGKRENLGRCSGVVAILFTERLHDKIQTIMNTMNDVIWMILKTHEGKQEKVCKGVCYNAPKGSRYENPHFYVDLENEISEIKNVYGGIDLIILGDFNSKTGDLMPKECDAEDEDEWSENMSFSNSHRRGEDKIINDEGRKLVNFCEILKLEILNGNREADWEGKMTFISKIGSSVIDYILCSHNIGSFMKTLQIKDSVISDHNIVETVIERISDTNGREVGRGQKIRDKGIYNDKLITVYKWYKDKREESEQRRYGKLTELFIIGINHLLGEGKIDEAMKTTSSLLDSIGWGMQKRIKKDYVTMGWFSEECRQGKEEALRA